MARAESPLEEGEGAECWAEGPERNPFWRRERRQEITFLGTWVRRVRDPIFAGCPFGGPRDPPKPYFPKSYPIRPGDRF